MGLTRRVRHALRGTSAKPVRASRSGADPAVLQQLVGAVQRAAPGAQVILYGSRARGDAQPDSDYDVLVLVNEPATHAVYKRIHQQVYDLALRMDVVVSLIVENRHVWESCAASASPLYENVRREGRPL